MAIKYGVKVLECDVCGHRWLPKGEKEPERCPVRSCWSRRWNDSQVIIGHPEATPALRAPQPITAAPASPADLMARLGLTTASRMHEQTSAPILTPVEDDEPLLPMCDYTEYDPESGETYQCGLRQHTFKVKHTRGARI